MEGFTVTHDACGQKAHVNYVTVEDWVYVDLDVGEVSEPRNVLTLICFPCGVHKEVEPKDTR